MLCGAVRGVRCVVCVCVCVCVCVSSIMSSCDGGDYYWLTLALENRLVVVNLPYDNFMDTFDTLSLLAFLTSAGTCFCVFYLVIMGYIQFYEEWAVSSKSRKTAPQLKLLEQMGGATVSKSVLIHLMRLIKDDVIAACSHSWRRYLAYQKKELSPISFDEVSAHV